MINNQIEYLFHLCMEAQKEESGYFKERCDWGNDKPEIFFELSGVVSKLEIRIYDRGWKEYTAPDKVFEFFLNEEIDQDKFRACRDYLLKLIEKQKEEE